MLHNFEAHKPFFLLYKQIPHQQISLFQALNYFHELKVFHFLRKTFSQCLTQMDQIQSSLFGKLLYHLPLTFSNLVEVGNLALYCPFK